MKKDLVKFLLFFNIFILVACGGSSEGGDEDSQENLPTQAQSDSNSLLEDSTLSVTAANGLLVNDSDPHDTLSVSQFTIEGLAETFNAGDTATINGIGELQINGDGSYFFYPY